MTIAADIVNMAKPTGAAGEVSKIAKPTRLTTPAKTVKAFDHFFVDILCLSAFIEEYILRLPSSTSMGFCDVIFCLASDSISSNRLINLSESVLSADNLKEPKQRLSFPNPGCLENRLQYRQPEQGSLEWIQALPRI